MAEQIELLADQRLVAFDPETGDIAAGMKSRSKNRTPSIENLTVKRHYLTEREVERLMAGFCSRPV
jgi:hypothetical protein